MIKRINENAGSLNERITIVRVARTADDAGGFTTSESNVNTLWANVSPMSGKERDMAAQTESPRNYRFTLRRTIAAVNIMESDTIVWREKRFNIRFIPDSGPKDMFMSIEAESGVAT